MKGWRARIGFLVPPGNPTISGTQPFQPPITPGATPAHVLNAAWNWRLRYPEADGAAVSTRALTRCAQAAL